MVLLFVVLLLIICSAPAQSQEFPEKLGRIDITSKGSPIVIGGRYPTWVYRERQSTVYPIRLRDGQLPDVWIIEAQNKELNDFGIHFDVIQFNPNPEAPEDWNRLRSNFLRVGNMRPFCLLYEHHMATRYLWIRQDGKRHHIDLSTPHNKRVFFEDMEFMLRNIIIPHEKNYISLNGKALIYLWAAPVFWNAGPVLKEAKQKYPIAFISGEDGFYPHEEPHAIERIKQVDIIMPYSLNRAAQYAGRYGTMIEKYMAGLYEWARHLEEHSPETILYTRMQFAFDDTNSTASLGRLPLYPDSICQVETLAERIIQIMTEITAERSVKHWGVFVIASEYFEGDACETSFPPSPSAKNFLIREALSGTARLNILRRFFVK